MDRFPVVGRSYERVAGQPSEPAGACQPPAPSLGSTARCAQTARRSKHSALRREGRTQIGHEAEAVIRPGGAAGAGQKAGIIYAQPRTPAPRGGDAPNPMEDLTPRQRDTLEAIEAWVHRHGYPPSRVELARTLRLAHGSSVDGHLRALVKRGYITITPNVNRGIALTHDEDTALPLVDWVEPVGEVAAGEPIVAEGRVVSTIPRVVAQQFSPRPDYFLTVRGTSMNRLGMHDGDLVAVRAVPEARDGEIVIARFGDEATVKRFRRIDERHIELHPESHNPEHKVRPIDLAKHILHIDGVVVGHLRGKSSVETKLNANDTT